MIVVMCADHADCGSHALEQDHRSVLGDAGNCSVVTELIAVLQVTSARPSLLGTKMEELLTGA